MNRQKLVWWFFGVMLLAFGIIQFIPAPPLQIPALLPLEQRAGHRLLNFEGITNFRDLGGYPAAGGKSVRWGALYRSGNLARASRSDLQYLEKLQLKTLIDFRSSSEKQEQPNQLPEPLGFAVVEIPISDDDSRIMAALIEGIEPGRSEGLPPNETMIRANRQFANEFTPQFRQFIDTVLQANGSALVWLGNSGKHRTGFASAILLRILGVSPETVMSDYLAGMTGVEKAWLHAAFAEIDERWGDFDTYASEGLQLTLEDITRLRSELLE